MLKLKSFTGGSLATNAYLLENESGAYLFDAPAESAAWLQSLGISLRALILTHGHYDHVLDAAAIQSSHGCPIWAHRDTQEVVDAQPIFLPLFGESQKWQGFHIDHTLPESPGQKIADLQVDIFHVPGHSPDSLCFYLPEENWLIGGDVLFQRSIGRTDLPGGNGSVLLEGIRNKLYPLPDATRVFPGHGPSTTIGEEKRENPFVRLT